MDWIKKHWWIVGAAPVAFGALMWVLMGGAAPWIESQRALGRKGVAQGLEALGGEGVADAVQALPDTAGSFRAVLQAIEDLDASVSALNAERTRIVEWAEARTLELNEGIVCVLNRPCTLWLRARYTPDGIDCDIFALTPYLIDPIRAVRKPIRWAAGWEPPDLTLRYQTFPVDIVMPRSTRLGQQRFVVVYLHSTCGFAPEGVMLERESIRVPLRVVRGQPFEED